MKAVSDSGMRFSYMYHVLYPEYYAKFSCIGGACKDNCCHGWQLPVTKTDYDKLRNWRGDKAVVDAIRENIKRLRPPQNNLYAEIVRGSYGGRCNFLDGDGLCRLQMNCGAQMLPRTCQTFPRAATFFAPIKIGIRSMFPACEEVVRLLLEEKDGLGFVLSEESAPNDPRAYFPCEGYLSYQYYFEIKSMLIDVLQNRAYTMSERMILVGSALKSYLDMGTELTDEGIEQWLRQTSCMTSGNDYRETLAEMKTERGFFNPSCIFVCATLPRIWRKVSELFHPIIVDGKLAAAELGKALEMENCFDENCADGEIILENLIVNYFFQYNIPFSVEAIWEQYCNLACTYRILRFMLTCYYIPGEGLVDIVEPIVEISRNLLYDQRFKSTLLDMLKEKEQNTLAHLAMLLKS